MKYCTSCPVPLCFLIRRTLPNLSTITHVGIADCNAPIILRRGGYDLAARQLIARQRACLRGFGALWHNTNMAILSYRNKATKDIALGTLSKDARRALPLTLHSLARRRLAYLAAVDSLQDLRVRPSLGLHALKNERFGQFAIKINDQYRICFEWDGRNATLAEIVDYH